jgi:hypothetical protein
MRDIKHVSGIHHSFYGSNVQQVQRQHQGDAIRCKFQRIRVTIGIEQLAKRRHSVKCLPPAGDAASARRRLWGGGGGGE